MTSTLTEAERFFYENAPSSYDPTTETEEQGRINGARQLAAAEERLTSGPYFVSIEPETEAYEGSFPYEGPLFVVCLFTLSNSTDAELIGSTGNVACEESDPYMRVLGAELALEYIPA